MLTSLKMKCAVKYLSLKCVSVLYMCGYTWTPKRGGQNYFASPIRKTRLLYGAGLNSPAQIRTGVKGSKGLYAWPLHSTNLIFSTGLPGLNSRKLDHIYNVM
jgi:hypothetical protein